jgi:ubiquinone/menaquinone biosynthesis C-methylase UbiE
MRSATRTEYDLLIRHCDRLAADYDRRWAHYTDAALAATLRHIAPRSGRQLLDVACGTGLVAAGLRGERPDLAITGVDICERMLEVARRRIPPNGQTRWLAGLAEELPVRSESFDVVTCISGLHCFHHPAGALAEMHRALRPGGTLILVDWCRDQLSTGLLGWWLNLTGPSVHRVLGLRACEDLLRAALFDVASAERFRIDWLWGMMCLVARRE